MVKSSGLSKKLAEFVLAGSLVLSPMSSNLLAEQRKISRTDKFMGYIFQNDRNYHPKYRYHNIESIMEDDNITRNSIEKERDPYSVGIFQLFYNYLFLDTLDEKNYAGVLLKFSDDGRVISKEVLLNDNSEDVRDIKGVIERFSKNRLLVGKKFEWLMENYSQLNEAKVRRIRTLKDNNKLYGLEFFDTKVAYEVENGIITDIIELDEDVYNRANRSEHEIVSGRIFNKNHKTENFLEYRSVNGGTTDGQRLKLNVNSGEEVKEFKTAFSTTEKDKSKWNLGLSIFNIKNNEQYGKIDEWDSFVKYSPERFYLFEDSEFSFMTGMTSTNKDFDAVRMNNYSLEQKLKTKSNPLLNFQALFNSRKQLTSGEEKPFLRLGIANVSGRDQYEWKWLNPDGSLNSKGFTTIPSNYTTASGDFGIKRQNLALSGGRSVNFFEQEENGQPRLYKHTINNLELAAEFKRYLVGFTDEQTFKTLFNLIYQSHSNRGYKEKDRSFASNIQVLLNEKSSGILLNYMHDGFNGNRELGCKIIWSPYSEDYINETSDIKRNQAVYDIRNNNNYLPSLSPSVSHVPLIIPRGIEITASSGIKYGERFKKASFGCYLYRKAGADIGCESVKKNEGKDQKITFTLKKAF